MVTLNGFNARQVYNSHPYAPLRLQFTMEKIHL